MGLKRYIQYCIIVVLSLLSILLLCTYLKTKSNYESLLRENLNFKRDKYELLQRLDELGEGLGLVRSRLNRYEMLKKETLDRITEGANKSSMFILPGPEYFNKMGKIADEYEEGIELLTSKLSYLSTRGAFQDIPSMWPTNGWISSTYGMRRHPIYNDVRFHCGIDIANRFSTPVFATARGRVIYVGRKGGYGMSVIIDHGNNLKTRYAHLNRILVRRGAVVRKGEEIALMGNSGISTGPHIHYEVRVDDRPDDPLKFIF